MGYLNTIGVGGTAFGGLVAGIMYDTMGFAINFIVSAAMMFVSARVVWAWVDDQKHCPKSSQRLRVPSRREWAT